MDKYLKLRLDASNKADYRKRPVDTANEVNEIVKKVQKLALEGKLTRRVKYDDSTPKRLAISEARKKAGSKAFKEQTKIFTSSLDALRDKIRNLTQMGAPKKDIDLANKQYIDMFEREAKYEKLIKEADKLKNEPVKYLVKLQEAKEILKEIPTPTLLPPPIDLSGVQTGLADVARLLRDRPETDLSGVEAGLADVAKLLKNKPAAQIEEIALLLKSQMSVRQLLDTEPKFFALTKKEKNAIVKELQSRTPYDTTTQKQTAELYLKATPEQQKAIIAKAKSLIPTKAVLAPPVAPGTPAPGTPVPGTPVPGSPVAKKAKEVVDTQIVEDILAKQRYADVDERDYVEAQVRAEPELENQTAVVTSIRYFKKEYQKIKPKASDFTIAAADADAASDALVDDATRDALNKAAKDKAIDDALPKFEHPGDAPIVDATAALLAADGHTPAEAKADAKDAVGATSAELNLKPAVVDKATLQQELDDLLAELGQNPSSRPVSPVAPGDATLRIKKLANYPKITKAELLELQSKPSDLVRVYELTNQRIYPEDLRKEIAFAGAPPTAATVSTTPEVNLPEITESNNIIRTKLQAWQLNDLAAKYGFDVSNLKNKGDKSKAIIAEKDRRGRRDTGKGFTTSFGRGQAKTVYSPNTYPSQDLENPVRKTTGEGFKPLSAFPHHLVAGSLAKHIDRVKANRLKTRMNGHAVMSPNGIENDEYRKGLTKRILKGGNLIGDMGDMFGRMINHTFW